VEIRLLETAKEDLRAGYWFDERQLAYRLEYSPATEDHLRVLTARQRAIVFESVDEQLAHQPGVETRNRKPMRPNPLAPWELRVGELRVYYVVVEAPEAVVTILAIGVKDRNRVLIGGKEIEL
jgi:mRNA-degrading endonuclease RelE of RelBE toxin-antitoxin system